MNVDFIFDFASPNAYLCHKAIQKLEKNYTRNEPEQFLAMYDAIRENSKDKK